MPVWQRQLLVLNRTISTDRPTFTTRADNRSGVLIQVCVGARATTKDGNLHCEDGFFGISGTVAGCKGTRQSSGCSSVQLVRSNIVIAPTA